MTSFSRWKIISIIIKIMIIKYWNNQRNIFENKFHKIISYILYYLYIYTIYNKNRWKNKKMNDISFFNIVNYWIKIKTNIQSMLIANSCYVIVINRRDEFDTAYQVEIHIGSSESGHINVENREYGLTNVERSVNRKRKARNFTIRLVRGIHA